jgi:hypothetical protein
MPRKVFTAGEVLAAADVNEFLMDQAVQSFAGTAARGSAIPTPVEGMYTHLEDTDSLQFWNGSAWRSPSGQTLISSSTFTTQTQILLDYIFTSEFDNYKIVGSISGSAIAGVNWQLRDGTSNLTTSTYSGVVINGYDSASSTQVGAQDNGGFGLVRSSAKRNILEGVISNPFNTLDTQTYSTVYDSVANGLAIQSFQNTSTASYNGLRIFVSAGTMTGSIQIYGLRK